MEQVKNFFQFFDVMNQKVKKVLGKHDIKKKFPLISIFGQKSLG